MKRLSRRLLLTMMMFGALFVSGAMTSQASAQGAQDFRLINRTGVEIYALYVSPHTSADWGDDILGLDTLPADEAVDITFARKERATFWDIRIEDSEGNYIIWERFNLRRISTITLYYRNGKATATYTD